MRTLYFVVLLFAIPIGYDVWTLTQEGVRTISNVIGHLGTEWNPFLAYGISALPGHFFIYPRQNVAKYLGEAGELFLFLWVGWGLFLYFRTHPRVLPLSNIEMAGVCLLGFLMGAFAWTLTA